MGGADAENLHATSRNHPERARLRESAQVTTCLIPQPDRLDPKVSLTIALRDRSVENYLQNSAKRAGSNYPRSLCSFLQACFHHPRPLFLLHGLFRIPKAQKPLPDPAKPLRSITKRYDPDHFVTLERILYPLICSKPVKPICKGGDQTQ